MEDERIVSGFWTMAIKRKLLYCTSNEKGAYNRVVLSIWRSGTSSSHETNAGKNVYLIIF